MRFLLVVRQAHTQFKVVSHRVEQFFLLCALVLSLTLQASFASENLIENARREISGFVSVVSPDYMSVVYDKDTESGAESEIGFSRDDSPELRNKRRWEDIRVGDTVKVEYDEEFESLIKIDENGAEEKYTRVISRKARTFIFEESASSPLIS